MNRNQILNVWVPKLEYGLQWARLHLITIAVVYCLIYIGQVTRTNRLGVKLNQLVAQRDDLYRSTQELNIQAVQLRTINHLKETSTGMVEPNSVVFAK